MHHIRLTLKVPVSLPMPCLHSSVWLALKMNAAYMQALPVALLHALHSSCRLWCWHHVSPTPQMHVRQKAGKRKPDIHLEAILTVWAKPFSSRPHTRQRRLSSSIAARSARRCWHMAAMAQALATGAVGTHSGDAQQMRILLVEDDNVSAGLRQSTSPLPAALQYRDIRLAEGLLCTVELCCGVVRRR